MAFPNENQQIIMVTGKGGVGKSAVAAAIAEREASRGRRTLLVELGDQSYFQYVYNRPIHYEPTQIEPNFSIGLWSGATCLREYVLYLVKVRTIVDLFFDNRVMRTFIKAAPALKELAILGKITSGIRKWGPPLDYDVIVVDGFATGHFLALLRAPIGMADLIESGPMGEQARNIRKVLEEPKLCSYIVVTIAEELPVSETIEVRGDLKSLIKQSAKVVCNRIYDVPVSADELKKIIESHVPKESKQFAEFLINLELRQSVQTEELKKAVGEFSKLPLVLTPNGQEVISKLSQQLGAL